MKTEHKKLVDEITQLDLQYEAIKRDFSGKPYLAKRKHILIYEDSETDAECVLEILARFEIDRVVHIKDANNWESDIAQHQPKVILLDIVMPGKSGYQVLREISEHPIYKLIPVVVLSSRKSLADIAWAKKCGAVAFIPKPVTNAIHLYKVLSDSIRNSQLHTLDLPL